MTIGQNRCRYGDTSPGAENAAADDEAAARLDDIAAAPLTDLAKAGEAAMAVAPGDAGMVNVRPHLQRTRWPLLRCSQFKALPQPGHKNSPSLIVNQCAEDGQSPSNDLAYGTARRHAATVNVRGSAVSLLLCAAAGAQAPASQPAAVSLAVLGDATPVTLKLEKTLPKEAFDKLEAASHIHIVLAQPDLLTRTDDHPITVTFASEPYLSAVLEMCRQAGLQVNFIGSRLMLLPSPDRRSIPPHTTAGPLAIYCNAAVISRELHYGATPTRSDSAVLSFSLISEPRVPVIGIDGPPTNVHAIDANGRPIDAVDSPNPAMRARFEPMVENRFFTVQLALGPDAGDMLRSVSGTVLVRTITKTDTLKINDLAGAEGTTTTLGDSQFTVTRVAEQPGGQCSVDIDVRSGSLSPIFFTRIRFADSQFSPRLAGPNDNGQIGNGKNVDVTGVPGPNGILQIRNVQTSGSVQTVSLQIIRPQLGTDVDKKPINLVWPLPSEVQRVEVPFVFHDLKIR